MSKMQQVNIRQLGREFSKPLNGDLPNPGPGGMIAQPEEPISPQVGTMWYNTSDSSTYVYYPDDGTINGWVTVGGSAK